MTTPVCEVSLDQRVGCVGCRVLPRLQAGGQAELVLHLRHAPERSPVALERVFVLDVEGECPALARTQPIASLRDSSRVSRRRCLGSANARHHSLASCSSGGAKLLATSTTSSNEVGAKFARSPHVLLQFLKRLRRRCRAQARTAIEQALVLGVVLQRVRLRNASSSCFVAGTMFQDSVVAVLPAWRSAFLIVRRMSRRSSFMKSR